MNEPTKENPCVLIQPEAGGSLWRVILNRPKGNVLDRAMLESLTAVVRKARAAHGLKTVLFEGAGPNFSFGASVPEHMPGEVEGMLPVFHELFYALADCGCVLAAAVRGRCLGGGLELAAFCHRVFSTPDAHLGNPEIVLGVFAPVSSIILPMRMGQAAADDLLLTGKQIHGEEAHARGLVDVLASDPAAAALEWHQSSFGGLSASSLAFAVGAARDELHARLRERLPLLERRYLEELMATHDAQEGIRAFMDKRTAQWTHR